MVVRVFPREFEKKKEKIKILILGAYRPSPFKRRLQTLRDYLEKKKYRTARLAANLENETKFHENLDAHFSMKSDFLIKNWADSLLFVFFKGADNSGVSTEFKFTCLEAREKLGVSVVFSEKDLNLSTQIKGPIRIHKVLADEFANDEELCEKSIGYCTEFVYRLYWLI